MEQIIINGIMLGFFYCLLALGITLVYSILRILNFAHGQMFMLGGVIIYLLYSELKMNYFLSLLLVVPVLGILGVLCDVYLFRRIREQARSGAIAMLLAIGMAIVLDEFILLTFGEKDKGVPPVVQGVLDVAGMKLTAERLLVSAMALVLILLFMYFVHRTRTGRAMRALAQNREAAYLQGADINRLAWLGFGIGAALAGVAGALIAPVFGIAPGLSGSITLKCFIVMLIGGFGSVGGAIVGSFILGFSESIGYTFLPGTSTFLFIYLAIILLLIFRPQGIMGEAR